MCKAAETELGLSSSRQPGWFRDSSTEVRPLLEERNRMYSLWLSTKQERDKHKLLLLVELHNKL